MSFLSLRDMFFQKANGELVTAFWKNKYSSDTNLPNVFLTIELIFGDGRKHRLATDLVQVTDSSGALVSYLPQLEAEPTIVFQYRMGQGQASIRSFALTVDARTIKPIEMILGGTPLAGFGEIALQENGGTYEERFILMKGDMVGGVTFGVNEAFIELELADPKVTANKVVPENFITRQDFSALPSNQEGQRFAVIMNEYEKVPCVRTSEYAYGTTFVVGAGHDLSVEKVFVNDVEYQSYDSDRGWNIVKAFTDRGIPYTGIDFIFPQDQNNAWESGDSVYAKVSGTNQLSSTNVIQSIRELTIVGTSLGEKGIDGYLFSKSEVMATSLFASILVNGNGERDTALGTEYIEQTLCKSFPMISMTYSGFGYGPVFTDRRSPLTVMTLVRGQRYLFDRVTEIQESPIESLFNKFTLRYSFNAATNNFDKLITAEPENNYTCEISRTKFGFREQAPLDSVVIYDDATARYVVDWLAAHYSLPSYYVEYEAAAGLFFALQVGDNVKITDDKLGITEVVCTVEKISYTHSRCVLGVRMWLSYERGLPSAAAIG